MNGGAKNNYGHYLIEQKVNQPRAADLPAMDDGGNEPRHWQHVVVVKVDVNHCPIHILQLAHLILTGLSKQWIKKAAEAVNSLICKMDDRERPGGNGNYEDDTL